MSRIITINHQFQILAWQLRTLEAASLPLWACIALIALFIVLAGVVIWSFVKLYK